MSEYDYSNPYALAPAQNVSMTDANRHESGNALAANSEARVVAEVKAQVLMARQFPRDCAMASDRILKECKRPTLAEAAVYSFPRGNETITGPSIRLAEVLARNWGNCTFGYEVLERKPAWGTAPGCSVIRAYAWDLETNTYVSRQFEVKHWRQTKNGGYPLKEDRDIYELESNMASRRMRACILQMIPGDVTQAAVNACRKTESTGLSERMKDKREREKIVKATVSAYEKLGVKVEDLEEMLHSKQDDWTADTMLKLKEILNAIKDNVSSIADYFPHLAANEKSDIVTKEQVKKLMEAAKATGQQGAISDLLKENGIAKFADVPAVKYEEVLAMIQSFGQTMSNEEAAAKLESPIEENAK